MDRVIYRQCFALVLELLHVGCILHKTWIFVWPVQAAIGWERSALVANTFSSAVLDLASPTTRRKVNMHHDAQLNLVIGCYWLPMPRQTKA